MYQRNEREVDDGRWLINHHKVQSPAFPIFY